ncbi:MAG: DUF4348 domain-containing protein [Bacteroidetes bacterium]|nr:DUF4348 domain-containing protein [Bacteroidota bacterium]
MKKWTFVFILICTIIVVQCNRKVIPVIEKQVKPTTKKEISKSASTKGLENFDQFYKRFHTDSIFQMSRIQFPLKGQKINFQGTFSWKKENWMMIKGTASEVDINEFNVKPLKNPTPILKVFIVKTVDSASKWSINF